MTTSKLAIMVDVYDKDGNMTKIEVWDGAGEHVMDVLWDDREAQTSENRISHREWARVMAKRKGYFPAE